MPIILQTTEALTHKPPCIKSPRRVDPKLRRRDRAHVVPASRGPSPSNSPRLSDRSSPSSRKAQRWPRPETPKSTSKKQFQAVGNDRRRHTGAIFQSGKHQTILKHCKHLIQHQPMTLQLFQRRPCERKRCKYAKVSRSKRVVEPQYLGGHWGQNLNASFLCT